MITGDAFDCRTAEAYLKKDRFPLPQLVILQIQSVLKAVKPSGLYLTLQSAISLQLHS